MPEGYHPERSTASQRAATLAHGSVRSRDSPSSPRSTWGNQAASLAFSAAGTSHYQNEGDDANSRRQSMRAAHGAIDGARPRAKSTPQKYIYPDQENATANALNAATVAHRQPSVRSSDAGAVPYTTMSREMFTSRPPVKPEVDEKQHADVLHASAVAMAKGMFARQQSIIDNAKKTGSSDAGTAAARSSSYSRRGVESPGSGGAQADVRYPNLQEAAYRLAQERLAKLQDQHQKDREFQDYYGAGTTGPAGGRLGSIRGKLTRKRSSSDGDAVVNRRFSSQTTTSRFNNNNNRKVPDLDEEKRNRDRQALLAAAQRNVKAQMAGMDRKVYEETGRIQPVKLSDWEAKAHSAALLSSETRRADDHGLIDIGGGKMMTQEEINAIAARNVQPLIDDISHKAEVERERVAALKMDQERQKEEAAREKAREHEVQDIHKKLKEEQKEEERRRKHEAKEAERLRKEQEKEEKRRAKEDKKKTKESPTVAAASGGNEEGNAVEETAPLSPADQPSADGAAEARPKSKDGKKPLALMLKKRVAKEDHEDAREDDSAAVEDGPRSPSKKGVKTWFKSHFSSRPRTKSTTSDHRPTTATDEQATTSNPTATGPADDERGFIGGAAFREQHSRGQSSVSSDSSLRDVALANVGPDTLREELPSPVPGTAAPEHASTSGAPISEPAAEALVKETAIEPLTKVTSLVPPEAEPATLDVPSLVTQEPTEPVTLREVTGGNPSVSSVSSLSSSSLSDEDSNDDLRYEDASPFTRAEMARPKSPLASLAAKVVEGEPQPEAKASTPNRPQSSAAEPTESTRPPTPPPASPVPNDPTTMAKLSSSPKRESKFAEIID
ncbi:hypothetical protein DL546_007051 [Coniochaeta pulveracea]|uniref:Eisosome protein 1 n=1 Tax=Coniochaeta pulveracea TaxID=177199 RepID=A0A420YDM5_9PEZI|nr:hypothetical protein DL546_007051 [Coniochaeta pulveracea]